MKQLVLAAAIVAMTAAPAVAQNVAPATPNPAIRQQMRQMRSQMMQMHQQFRTQVLAALTPAHKALLASIAGNLATATTPDYRAAAAQLDAVLSPTEKQNIMSAAQTMRTSMRANMQSMMQRMPMNGMPMNNMPMNGGHMMRTHRSMTAGAIVLMAVMPGGGMMMHR